VLSIPINWYWIIAFSNLSHHVLPLDFTAGCLTNYLGHVCWLRSFVHSLTFWGPKPPNISKTVGDLEARFQWTTNSNWHMANPIEWLRDWNGGIAEVDTLWVLFLVRPPGTTVPDGLMFHRRCFFFFRQPNLRGPSADRRETLPHDRNLVAIAG